MTPFGYRIHDARAVAHAAEQQQLTQLFTAFVAGAPLKACAKEAQIPRVPATCKRMLANATYLGTDFYPPLIPPDLFRRAQEELGRRAESRKPRKAKRRVACVPVLTEFVLLPAAQPAASLATPQDYAALMLSRIQPASSQQITGQTKGGSSWQ